MLLVAIMIAGCAEGRAKSLKGLRGGVRGKGGDQGVVEVDSEMSKEGHGVCGGCGGTDLKVPEAVVTSTFWRR